MKTTSIKIIFSSIFIAASMASCVADSDYATPKLSDCEETSLVANRTVTDINFSSNIILHQNITPGVADVIEAYVVSSDIGGNFFKNICCQTLDGSQAFNISVDASSLFINYPPGSKVLIDMTGLYTQNNTSGNGTGGRRIGDIYANTTGGAEIGRLPEAQFSAAVQKSCASVSEDVLVQTVTISEAKSDNYLNKLIEIENVQFETSATESTYYNPADDIGSATNYNLLDNNGNSIIFRTSAYAAFADKAVTTGSGKVRGIVTKYGSDYQFFVRSEKDIMLTEPRFYVFNSDFESGIGNWTTYSVTGAQVWTWSSVYGNPGAMMKMSGYSGGNKANEDWLISPVFNLETYSTASLSLDNAYSFTGNPITIMVSNNYPGTGSPTASGVTWTTLSDAILSSGSYVYANTGSLNIDSFTGTGNSAVYVAVKYTSTTSGASTWEIDNFGLVAF
jgi:hypothetical protein